MKYYTIDRNNLFYILYLFFFLRRILSLPVYNDLLDTVYRYNCIFLKDQDYSPENHATVTVGKIIRMPLVPYRTIRSRDIWRVAPIEINSRGTRRARANPPELTRDKERAPVDLSARSQRNALSDHATRI